MGASSWVPQECADLVCRLRRQNVLEFACLLLDFGFAVHSKAVGEQTPRQPVSPDDVRGFLSPTVRHLYDQCSIAHRSTIRLQRVVTWVDKRLVIVGLGRMWA